MTAIRGGAVTLAGAADAFITGNSIGTGEVAFSPDGRIVAGAPAAGDTLALWTLP